MPGATPNAEGSLEKPVVDMTQRDEAFEDAFNEAEAAAPAVENAENFINEEPKPEAQKLEAPAPETPAPAEGKAPDPPPESLPPEEEEEKFQQRYRTLQGIHKHDKETWESEKADLLAKIEEAKKPVEPPPPNEAPVKADIGSLKDILANLTADQKAELDAYEEDFDVVSKMEGLKRDAALSLLRKELQAFKDDVFAQLAPAQNIVKEVQQEREVRSREEHFATIKGAHADFEKYRDDGSIIKWIESKPKYMQPALMSTYKQGQAEDVIEFLSDFKKENNITEAPAAVRTNEKLAQKKAAITAVPTKRGAVNAAMSVANSFEDAFDEALSK